MLEVFSCVGFVYRINHKIVETKATDLTTHFLPIKVYKNTIISIMYVNFIIF